jgi:hypothetical protein
LKSDVVHDDRARYFPISPRPLKMVAGLSRFGTDFGQGAHDQRFFQLDGQRAHYLMEKRRAAPERHMLGPSDEVALRARAAALSWMRATLAREAPQVLTECEQDGEARDEFDALGRALQEDFCVVCAGERWQGRTTVVDVRFPSAWRPERLVEATFAAIHAPVPHLLSQPGSAESMVRSMVERGPFVRFIWTLSPDDKLDHHPDAPARSSWEQAAGVWLRVERQVTVPLTTASASLFLIRTYQYAWSELTPEQRARTLTALAIMPAELRAYKGLPEPSVVTALL